MTSEVEISKLKVIFASVCAGHSMYILNSKIVYIKHFCVADDLDVDFFYNNKYSELVNRGIYTEKDKLKYLIKNNLWDEKREGQIKFARDTIADLYKNKSKIYKFSDIQFYKSEIAKNEEFLINLLTERAELIDSTAENSARRASDLLLIQKSFFSDKQLTKSLYTEEEFAELSSGEIDRLYELYYQSQNDLSEPNFKKIAIQNFFNNLYFLSEKATDFFGGSIVSLTKPQNQLLIWANYFKNVLQNNDIPAEIMDDPEKISDWVAGKRSIEAVISNNTTPDGIVSLVGVDKKTLDFYGVSDPAGTALNQKMDKELSKVEGGELSFEESMRLGFV